jgi:hypothetical protein
MSSTRGADARWGRHGHFNRLALGLGALMALAASAPAHAGACDTLKSTLAERIEATGVRGYSLEAVPGRAPVPSGAKVIGTCEGGATKILYRRWAAAPVVSDAASEAKPAAPSRVAAVPREVPAPAPSLPRAVVVPAVAASATSPAPIPMQQPVAMSTPASAASAPAELAATRVAVTDPGLRPANDVEVVRTAEHVVVAPEQPVEATVPLTQRASDFIAGHWRWMVALLLVPLAAWGWAWHARRSYYDEAGLPRGPKL